MEPLLPMRSRNPAPVLVIAAVLLSAVAAATFGASSAVASPTLLVDVASGKVLHQNDAGRAWFPASVTKLMTTYVALARIREGRVWPESLIAFSANAEAQDASKMGFPAGTEITLENGLRMLMVKSANDVAVAIAESLGGSVEEFATLMNSYARILGMNGSHFVNPHGLPDPEQYTTARDMAILTRALIQEFPQAAELFHIPAIKLGKIRLRNHNGLLHRYPGADGMKTGFICSGGFNLVATATRNNRRLIAIVFGARTPSDRDETAANLLEAGFQPNLAAFATRPAIDALGNLHGTPPDLRDQVCGKGRHRAADSEDDAGAVDTGSDPDGIRAVLRYDRAESKGQPDGKGQANGKGQKAPPSILGPVVIGTALPVYLGPARGDTILAGIAPERAPAVLLAAAPQKGGPRTIDANGTPVAAAVLAGQMRTPDTPGLAYAPTGVTRATVPFPRPRPQGL